jgi:3-hydroxyisobutyrate dehydrogenase-like beta-hydroxyacid dehydrogenase
MTEAIESIGFIGLGVMGEPMCRNVVRHGAWTVIVHDLDPSPIARLAKDGARPASSPEEVAAGADLLLTCLPGGDQVRGLMLGEDGLISRLKCGQAYVDMSTSPPALMREIAEMAPDGVLTADAPIARTRAAAADGTLLIMVGGDLTVFERLSPVMRTMGSDVVHCGPLGAGQVAKILNNMVLFETVAALAEAIEIGERSGIPPDALLDILSLGSADSFALGAHGRSSLASEDYPEQAFSVRYAAKDLSYARAIADETGVRAPGADHVAALFNDAIEAGCGDQYFPVIRKLLKPRSSG